MRLYDFLLGFKDHNEFMLAQSQAEKSGTRSRKGILQELGLGS
jgi:hypothetical protein